MYYCLLICIDFCLTVIHFICQPAGLPLDQSMHSKHCNRKSATVHSLKHRKVPQCSCQAEMVIDSSFTPRVALLVHPSGTVATSHNELSWIYKVTNIMPVKADPFICSSVNGVSGIWLPSCTIMAGFGKSSR